jgi:osmotically-inducible protein OsmY
MVSFTGCAGSATRESTGEVVDDAAITTKVKAALVKDEIVKAREVKVETFKGDVQLSGFVNTAVEKTRAGEVAGSVAGVHKVRNDIVVK